MVVVASPSVKLQPARLRSFAVVLRTSTHSPRSVEGEPVLPRPLLAMISEKMMSPAAVGGPGGVVVVSATLSAAA